MRAQSSEEHITQIPTGAQHRVHFAGSRPQSGGFLFLEDFTLLSLDRQSMPLRMQTWRRFSSALPQKPSGVFRRNAS